MQHFRYFLRASTCGYRPKPRLRPHLFRLLRVCPTGTVRSMPPDAPAGFVGREAELSLLSGFLRELPRGTGNAVLIEGEPGIGKTALVRALVKKAMAPQALELAPYVCWGTGEE